MRAARQRVLAALRRAAGNPALPVAAPLPAGSRPRADPERALQAFAAELDRLGARLHRPATTADALDAVIALAALQGPRPVLSWAPGELPLEGIWPALQQAGLPPLEASLPAEPAARAARLEELAHAATGLTGAFAAVVESGALLLAGGAGRSRLAWLLPERHVALLPRGVLVDDLGALAREHPERLVAGAGVALVAGASRTADIELTLTRGVHGPRHLDVVLLP